jgi:hypothetical protein
LIIQTSNCCACREILQRVLLSTGMISILNHTIVIMSTQSFPPHETLPVNEKSLASERSLRIVVPFSKNLTIYLVYGAEKTNQDKRARGP